MTKQEINSILEQAITKHGFTFEYRTYSWMPVVPQTISSFAGISIMTRMEWGAEKMSIIEQVYCEARICQMGGSVTSDDLRKAADEINRAASLMDEINSMGLTCETGMKK